MAILPGLLVLNVDASYFAGTNSGACGAVVRDHKGRFITAATARLEHAADVVAAETAALFEGLKLALSVGCAKLMVRMDNSVVMDAIKLNKGNSMVSAPVLDDCRNILGDFGKVTIEHCFRESNVVAHELAKWGCANDPHVWADAPPNFLVKFLADDVTVI